MRQRPVPEIGAVLVPKKTSAFMPPMFCQICGMKYLSRPPVDLVLTIKVINLSLPTLSSASKGDTERALLAHIPLLPVLDWSESCRSLPRVGVHLGVPPEYKQAHWYGRGPHECYPDRQYGAPLRQYAVADVKEFHVPYIFPSVASTILMYCNPCFNPGQSCTYTCVLRHLCDNLLVRVGLLSLWHW